MCIRDETDSVALPHTPAHHVLPSAEEPADAPQGDADDESFAQVTHRAGGVRDTDPHTPRADQFQAADEALLRAQYEEAELERLRQEARRTYLESAQAGLVLSARALGEAYGMSESWGRKQILAVRDDETSRPQLRAVGDGADTAAA